MSMKTITNDIFSSLVSSSKTTGYDTTATVTRIDNDGVCWVHIDGGVAETPTSMAVNAIPGDIVRVRVSGGDAWITGNDSKPPTDDAEAFVANRKAVTAQSYAEIAQENAEIAQENAEIAQENAEQANENAVSALAISNSNSDILYGNASVSWETEGSISDSDIDVDPLKLANTIQNNGTYIFSFNGTEWVLDENPIELSEYGIAVNDTPTNNDQITFTVSDVSIGLVYGLESTSDAVKQIDNDLKTTSDAVKQMDDGLKTTSSALEDLNTDYVLYRTNLEKFIYCGPDYNNASISLESTGSNSEDNIDVEKLKFLNAVREEGIYTISFNGTEWVLDGNPIELTKYGITINDTPTNNDQITFTVSGINPAIILSDGTDSGLQTSLTSGQLTFFDNGYPVAYINGQKLYINSAQINEQLRFGNFAFIPRSNGNLSLKYVGQHIGG